MGVYWFRLRNEALIACRGRGWPLKKTVKTIVVKNNNKVVSFADVVANAETVETLEVTAAAA